MGGGEKEREECALTSLSTQNQGQEEGEEAVPYERKKAELPHWALPEGKKGRKAHNFIYFLQVLPRSLG